MMPIPAVIHCVACASFFCSMLLLSYCCVLCACMPLRESLRSAQTCAHPRKHVYAIDTLCAKACPHCQCTLHMCTGLRAYFMTMSQPAAGPMPNVASIVESLNSRQASISLSQVCRIAKKRPLPRQAPKGLRIQQLQFFEPCGVPGPGKFKECCHCTCGAPKAITRRTAFHALLAVCR